MKFFSILLACVCTIFGGYTNGHNGQPGCFTSEELDRRVWRNNFDNTRYWVCIEKGQPGIEVPCPNQQGFLDTKDIFGCVNWSDWKWIQPYDPPTMI